MNTAGENHASTSVGVEVIFSRTLEVLDAVPYVVLATTDGNEVSARQVQALTVESDLTVWVGTSPRSRKVAELSERPTATLVAEDFERFTCASINCDVTVVEDTEVLRNHWIEGLRPFFADGPGGDDFVLLRIRPRRIELLDFAAGITPAPYGLVPAAIALVDGAWQQVAHPRN